MNIYKLFFCLLILTIISCVHNEPEPTSLKEYYENSLRESEQKLQGSASFNALEKVINDYPTTKYSGYATLRIAENLFNSLTLSLNSQDDIEKARQYYQSFLITNSNHFLEPYVLNRLTQIAYISSQQGFFVKGTEAKQYDDVLQIFNNFQLLYPDSIYFDEIKYFAKFSGDKLAEYEHAVGDWYFSRKLYDAAINRYIYISTNFPDYPKNKEIAKKLIEAYQLNFQPQMAKQYEESYRQIYP